MTKYEDVFRPLPAATIDGLMSYLQGRATGGFLMAVLRNDLRGTFDAADYDNMVGLPTLSRFLYNRFPMHAYGDPERVATYQADEDLQGEVAKWVESEFGGWQKYAEFAAGYHNQC